jgi:hypothetical protein
MHVDKPTKPHRERCDKLMDKHFVIIVHERHFGIVWRGHSAGAPLSDPRAVADVIAMVLEAAGASAEVLDDRTPTDDALIASRS